jgi:hypothetical protein
MAIFSARISPRDVCTPMTRPARRTNPHDRVVTRGAPAALQQSAVDRKTRVLEIEEGRHAAHVVGEEQFRIHAAEAHRVSAPRRGIPLGIRVKQVQHAALAHHRVVVEVLLEPFPELHRVLVERLVARQQIVRADDRRIAARVARADVALLEERHVADAVVLREVVGGREAVPPAADDDHVVRGLRGRVAPCGGPAAMPGKRLAHEAQQRIAHAPS